MEWWVNIDGIGAIPFFVCVEIFKCMRGGARIFVICGIL